MVGGWGGTPLSTFNLGFRVAYMFVYIAGNIGYTYLMLLLLMLMLNVTVCIIYFITLAHLSVTP